MCGELQWSALGRNRAAVVGFNAEGNFFGNHPLSGFPAVGDAVSCTFELGKRRKRQDMEIPPANMMMELPADPQLRTKVESCLNAFDFDSGLLLLGTTAENLAEMLESQPCPCSRGQAVNDYGRFIPQRGVPQCYVSTEPIKIRLLVSDITLTQQCCYGANGYVVIRIDEIACGSLFHTILIILPFGNNLGSQGCVVVGA